KRNHWGYYDYEDLLTRMIFHFQEARDESELVWSSIVHHSDRWSASQFRSSWKELQKILGKRVDLTQFTFREALAFCMDNLKELVGPPEDDNEA
ncbi:hypothetical protein HDU91_002586, partial [Kappamyces sp. JEL0680]